MFKWIGKMLGIVPAEDAAPLVLTDPVKTPAPAKKPAAKKPAAKKAAKSATMPKTVKKPAAKKAAPKAKADGLEEMNKRDLLALAKEKGVKSNASMNKDSVIEAIRKG
jgi:hypothetical protein